MKNLTLLLCLTLSLACTNCSNPPPTQIPSHEAALVVNDGLTPAQLVPVAANASAIDPSTLTGQALAYASLPAADQTALQDSGAAGDLSRAFVKFAVDCAFNSSQSFSFSWTDGGGTVHNESYVGSVALATGWASAAASTTDQEWVTACLASKVQSGTVVTISARGSALTTPTSEKTTYTRQEGGFYGNVFQVGPVVYACAGSQSTYAQSHGRACTGVGSCTNITASGICGGGATGACSAITNTYYGNCYSSTARTGTQYVRVITTYMH